MPLYSCLERDKDEINGLGRIVIRHTHRKNGNTSKLDLRFP
jgi:hypothetical protein